jgi:hypothetical protein
MDGRTAVGLAAGLLLALAPLGAAAQAPYGPWPAWGGAAPQTYTPSYAPSWRYNPALTQAPITSYAPAITYAPTTALIYALPAAAPCAAPAP